MKRIFGSAGLIALLALPISLNAQYQDPPPQAPVPQSTHYGEGRWNQNHGEFTAYGDLFRVTPKGGNAVNFVGLGGRVGFNVHPNIALEGEMSYDFDQNYTTVSNNGNT